MSIASYVQSWVTTVKHDLTGIDYSAIKVKMNTFVQGAILAAEKLNMLGPDKKALVMAEAEVALRTIVTNIPGVNTAGVTLFMAEVAPVIMGCLSSDIDMLCNYVLTPPVAPVAPAVTVPVAPVAPVAPIKAT